jgi:hypothetical protein
LDFEKSYKNENQNKTFFPVKKKKGKITFRSKTPKNLRIFDTAYKHENNRANQLINNLENFNKRNHTTRNKPSTLPFTNFNNPKNAKNPTNPKNLNNHKNSMNLNNHKNSMNLRETIEIYDQKFTKVPIKNMK